MQKLLFSFLLAIYFLPGRGQKVQYQLETDRKLSYQSMVKGFQSPPSESRLRCYWWWLNGMATKESITRDLEEMKAKGYGGASLVDAGSSNYDIAAKTQAGPVFMSPAWMELYRHAVKEAARCGIELSVNLGSGWNPGGPSITPEFAMKKIVWSEIHVTGGKKVKTILPKPEINLWYSDIAVQAIPTPKISAVKNEAIQNWDKKSFQKAIGWKGIYPLRELREDYVGSGLEMAIKSNKIIDLTTNFKDSILEWTAPAGEWTIIRYGYTCTGATTSTTSDGWNGLSLDHLSAEAFNLFSKTVIIPLIETAQSAGNSVHFLQTDSWEMGVVSWTKNFSQEFKKFRGYDLNKFLPVLAGRIVDNRETSDRFLHDFRKTIGDCVENYHYQLLSNLAHQYGLGIHPESGGPHSAPVDALKVMAISDFPQGEFWAMANSHRIKDDERLSVRQSACVAHTNGRRFVAAEGPTSIGPQWERSPKDLKGNIDRVFCSGVNRIVWHTFTSSPKEFGLPGNEYFAGTHLNPNVTWWNYAGDFISYLNRCSYMLQQGLFVADVLYYYGDDVPNFVFLKEDLPQLKFGHDWDKCSKDVILNRLSFDGKKIVLPDGMSYRLLMLTPEKAIDLNVLKKIESLVKVGMTVVGPRPEIVSELSGVPQSDAELKEITNKLWGKIDGIKVFEHKYGKGKVIWGRDVNQILKEMNVVPDFDFKGGNSNTSLDYIHRSMDGQEVYFVSNRFAHNEYNDFQYRYIPELPNRYEQVECKFRVSGMVPELWDPLTGQISMVSVYCEENGYTTIPMHFTPEGSWFVVFRKKSNLNHIVKLIQSGRNIFPDGKLESDIYPFFEAAPDTCIQLPAFYHPGKYDVLWSDGKIQSFVKDSSRFSVNLSNNWELSFNPDWGVKNKMEIPDLKSWTEFPDADIKYYSGTALYTRKFVLSDSSFQNQRWFLDLGNVQEMASLRINGYLLPVLWCAPFRYNVSSYLLSGENIIVVEVTNLWVNRLVGDGQINILYRRTKTNINKFNQPDAEKYLRISGLLGPVTLQCF